MAEKAVVVVMTIEPTEGALLAMARPQQAWNSETPTSDSRIIGTQSRRGSAIGRRIRASMANRKSDATR